MEETERERFDFELEKFKKEQGRSLDVHKNDIEKLKNEKRKIQSEYNAQIDALKRDMDKRLEKDRKGLQEQLKQEIEQAEADEQAKYERKLE